MDLVGAEHSFLMRERYYSAAPKFPLMLTHSYLTPSSSTPYFVMLQGALGCFRLDGLSTIPRSARTTNPTRRKGRRPGRETKPSRRRRLGKRTNKSKEDRTGHAWIEQGKPTHDLGETIGIQTKTRVRGECLARENSPPTPKT